MVIAVEVRMGFKCGHELLYMSNFLHLFCFEFFLLHQHSLPDNGRQNGISADLSSVPPYSRVSNLLLFSTVVINS